MKLLFQQRMFSWFDSYNIFGEDGETIFTVQGKMGWGHRLHILDREDVHIATLKQVVLSMMPRFDFYERDERLGCIKRKWRPFSPIYEVDFKGWKVSGNFLEWDYKIEDPSGQLVATISKELFHLTDTYAIDTVHDEDALTALMVTLAIDAEKCSRN